MSSQAERIKAFKLAQHARLQKQEEEEQWISSEELCTEGSSDEETHTNVKATHRKPKRNSQSEKRGISPLAQTPQNVDVKSTSTYQQDSNYLLPNIHSSKPEEQHNASNKQQEMHFDEGDSCPSSSQLKIPEHSIDSEEELELEKLIQWRPKRGSIKLPDFPEGELKRFEHVIFEMNTFYEEMMITINSLKRKPSKRKLFLPCNIKDDTPSNQNLLTKAIKEHPILGSLLEEITKLESLISENDNLYQMVNKERKIVQNEMCGSLQDELDTNAEKFIQLCKFEQNSPIKNNVTDQASDQHVKKTKVSDKCDKNFVKRNIELQKKYTMTQYSLTDEEKVKLESLLSDIDSEEYSVKCSGDAIMENKKVHVKTVNDDENDTIKNNDKDINHFKLKGDEISLMANLDTQLNEILQSYDQPTGRLHITDEADILKSSDKAGKLWKHQQLQKRLEKIEKDLTKIFVVDAKEQKKQNDFEDNCCEDEIKITEHCYDK